jgi:hypothetical protein
VRKANPHARDDRCPPLPGRRPATGPRRPTPARRDFLDRYEVHQIGGRTNLEYWIPAEDLDTLNENMIDVVAKYR